MCMMREVITWWNLYKERYLAVGHGWLPHMMKFTRRKRYSALTLDDSLTWSNLHKKKWLYRFSNVMEFPMEFPYIVYISVFFIFLIRRETRMNTFKKILKNNIPKSYWSTIKTCTNNINRIASNIGHYTISHYICLTIYMPGKDGYPLSCHLCHISRACNRRHILAEQALQACKATNQITIISTQ